MEAGANSQMVSIVTAAMVLVTVLFLTPLFHNLPEATLGAIVIHAVWHLINFHKIQRYYTVRRMDFWAALTALVGVVLLGILGGLVLAVFVSLMALLISVKNPQMAVMGKLPESDIELRFAQANEDVRTYMRRDGLEKEVGSDHFYDSVQEGVGAYLREQQEVIWTECSRYLSYLTGRHFEARLCVYIRFSIHTSSAGETPPMRTNVVIDDQLISEAISLTGIKTKRGVIDHALRLLVRNGRQRALLNLEGKIHWEGDLDELRSGRFLHEEAGDYHADEDPELEQDRGNGQERQPEL